MPREEEKCTSRYSTTLMGIVQCVRSMGHAGDHHSNAFTWKDGQAYITDEITSVSARDRQVGGDHYKTKSLQPWDVWDAFELDPYEANAVKYLLRWRKKNGVEDLEKAKHYIDAIIEREQRKNVSK